MYVCMLAWLSNLSKLEVGGATRKAMVLKLPQIKEDPLIPDCITIRADANTHVSKGEVKFPWHTGWYI